MLDKRINCGRLAGGVFAFFCCGVGQAFVIDTSNSDWNLRWDTTLKYSAGFRVQGKEGVLASDPNINDGDNNFDRGLISNRLDLFTEVDTDFKKWLRFRASYAGWYDDVYRGDTDNTGSYGAATYNSLGRSSRQFPGKTRELMGRDGEVLDLMGQVNTDLMDMPLTLRLGKHAMFWGESLFFPTLGVSGAMAPLDAIKATSVPNTQARELLLPVNQMSGALQFGKGTTLEWFYQFEWRPTRLPPPGAYFSPVDFLPEIGGQALLVPAPPPAPPGTLIPLPVVNDLEAKDSGQFGIALRHYSEKLDADLGIYFVNFHQKGPPNFNLNAAFLPLGPGGALVPVPISVQPFYAEDIQVTAVSYSGFHLGMNVAGEVSYWHDAPLVSMPAVNLPGVPPFDNDDRPGYALSDQVHAQISFIRTLTETKFWEGGNVLGEFALIDVVGFNRNRAARDPTRDRTAYGFRALAQPQWYQVLPSLDLTGRLGVGYNFKGNSLAELNFNGNGATRGGDVTFGIDFDYKKIWFGGVSYTNFFGSDRPNRLNNYLDRDFVSINIKRTF
nr:G495 [uncultured bacterium]